MGFDEEIMGLWLVEDLECLCNRRKLFRKFSQNGEEKECQSLKYGVRKQLPAIFSDKNYAQNHLREEMVYLS